MSAPVFISYSSKDREIAETICKALESRGIDCWISCRDVRPGENFQEAIVKALRSARVMLLVFSSNANNSDEIKKELVLAGRHRVIVMPARVEDVVPNDAFSYEFATRQWVDLFKDWEFEIEQLAIQLGRVLQTAATPDAAGGQAAVAQPPPRAFGPRKPNWGGARVAALIAVLMVAAGGAVWYLRPVPPQPPQQTPPPQQSPALPASADETAWQSALRAASVAAFDDYLKAFPNGDHVEEARLRVADLILADAATSDTFDGAWLTRWTCPNLGHVPGYTYEFAGVAKGSKYHGVKGAEDQPGSLVLDGRILADGTAAFFGKGVVSSSVVAMGLPVGSQYFFHALAQFEGSGGSGTRVEGRSCTLNFSKP
jgi:hypothetical protein